MTIATLPIAAPAAARALPAAYWSLRLGAALCFVGHGAFGFITKAAWLPYFAVVGIPEAWAWRLMPLVGAVDVLAATAVLFAPRGLPLLYMAAWATWTALLRPLAGEPAWEALERAGNYGVPLALLALTGVPRVVRDLVPTRPRPLADAATLDRGREILRWTTAALLLGHGALGALTGKAMLAAHYAAVGLPASTTALVGWGEIVLAAAVALRPSPRLLVAVAGWKLASEALWLAAGAPLWELVERGGSVAAPLALAALLVASDRRHGSSPASGDVEARGAAPTTV